MDPLGSALAWEGDGEIGTGWDGLFSPDPCGSVRETCRALASHTETTRLENKG